MNRAWIISIAVSLILIGGGAAGVFYIMKSVPGQMTVQAVLSAPRKKMQRKRRYRKIRSKLYSNHKSLSSR